MEFQARAAVFLRDSDLQRQLRIETLPLWCDSIDKVLSQQGDKGEIYCIWGAFRIHREMICDGVRFTLPTCPNALQWTVTADPRRHDVLVHCTINKDEHDEDFIASIEQFVADWKAGLEAGPERLRAAREGKRVGECTPTYGGFG